MTPKFAERFTITQTLNIEIKSKWKTRGPLRLDGRTLVVNSLSVEKFWLYRFHLQNKNGGIGHTENQKRGRIIHHTSRSFKKSRVQEVLRISKRTSHRNKWRDRKYGSLQFLLVLTCHSHHFLSGIGRWQRHPLFTGAKSWLELRLIFSCSTLNIGSSSDP